MKLLSLISISIISLPSYALDLEVGAGITRFGKSDNGTWYQNGNPHSISLTSESFKLGITKAEDGWRSHLGIEFLGRYNSWCYATSDYAYFTGGDYPFSNYYGKGHVSGLYITQGPEYFLGSYKIHPTFGLFAYRAKWTVYIPDWIPCKNNLADGPSCEPDTPRVYGVRNKNEILITPLLGISFGKADWSIDINIRTAAGGQLPTITKGITWNIGLTHKY